MKPHLFAAAALLSLLSACANSPVVESLKALSGEGDAGGTVTLAQPTPGVESHRLFEQAQASTASLQSVRATVEANASEFCARNGTALRTLSATSSRPPYTLGNFARVELVFECVAKPAKASVREPVANATKAAASAPASTSPAPATESAPKATAPAPELGRYDKLAIIKKLLDNGTLTQREFEIEKAKILAGP
jgi:hypothetical protein